MKRLLLCLLLLPLLCLAAAGCAEETNPRLADPAAAGKGPAPRPLSPTAVPKPVVG
jgi:hypothetical protein